jgi:hypothetical protein
MNEPKLITPKTMDENIGVDYLIDLGYSLIYDLEPETLRVKLCSKQFPDKYLPRYKPNINSYLEKYTGEVKTKEWKDAVSKWEKEKFEAGRQWRVYLDSLQFEDVAIQEELNTIWHISGLNPQLEQFREDYGVPSRQEWATSEYRKHADFVVEFTKDINTNDYYDLDD